MHSGCLVFNRRRRLECSLLLVITLYKYLAMALLKRGRNQTCTGKHFQLTGDASAEREFKLWGA